THRNNHSGTRYLCANIDSLNPREIVPGGKLDLLVASPECFPAGTLIFTEDGLKPIEQIPVRMNVLTHQRRWKPVTEVMRAVKDTVIVHGHGHFGLETTTDHPFLARQRRKHWPMSQRSGVWRWSAPEWKKASDLKGSFWATPTAFPPARTIPVPPYENRF